jgi:hypothetical protein
MSAHVDDEVDGRPQAFEVRLVLRLFLDATGENELRAGLLRNIDCAVLSLDPSDPADVEEVVCALSGLSLNGYSFVSSPCGMVFATGIRWRTAVSDSSLMAT